MNDDYPTYLQYKQEYANGTLNSTVSRWQKPKDQKLSTAEDLAVWSMMGLLGIVWTIALFGLFGLL
jgi:hypothetical protein